MTTKRPPRRRYPPLPAAVDAPGGAVAIELRPGITHEGAGCWGLYDHERRVIQIDRTVNRRHQWKTLYHELAHVALLDAGLDNGMTDALHEAICDAIATARVRERFG